MDHKFFLILVEIQNDFYSMSFNEFSDHINLEKANVILGRFVAKINDITYDESKIKMKFFAIVVKLKVEDVINLVENKLFLQIPFAKVSFTTGTLNALDNDNLPPQINFVLKHNFSSAIQQQTLVDHFKGKWTELNYNSLNSTKEEQED